MNALTTNSKVWKILSLIFIALSLLFALFFYFDSIFITIVTAVILILITEDLRHYYRHSVKKYNWQGWKRHLQKYGVLLFWIFIILFVIVTSISSLAASLQTALSQNVTVDVRAIEYLDNNVLTALPDFIRFNFFDTNSLQRLVDLVFGFFADLFSELSFIIFNGIIIIPLMFYAYYKKRKMILQRIKDVLPDKFRNSIIQASNDIADQLYEFFNAKVLESTMVALICCFGFFIGGVKGWLIFGIIAGVLNIVPYIGPIVGAVPPMLMSILVDDPTALIIVIITVAIAQLIDNFYLQPFMIPGKVKIDSLIAIILILVGAKILGVMGMIFAIPVYLVYKTVLRESYQELVKLYK